MGVKDDGGDGDNWSYKMCKASVKSSPSTYHHPNNLQAGCPSCHPTNSVRALKGESTTFHGLAHHQLTWGSSVLVLIINTLAVRDMYTRPSYCSIGRRSSVWLKLPAASQGYSTHAATWWMEIQQSALAANALCFLKVGIWGLTRAAASDPKWRTWSTC